MAKVLAAITDDLFNDSLKADECQYGLFLEILKWYNYSGLMLQFPFF